MWKTRLVSVRAAAVMALGMSIFARMRRKYRPSHGWLRTSAYAAMCRALARRWLTRRVRELSPSSTRNARFRLFWQVCASQALDGGFQLCILTSKPSAIL